MTIFDAVDLSGKTVALLWHAGVDPEQLKSYVADFQGRIGSVGHLSVENVERLSMCMYRLDLAWLYIFVAHIVYILYIYKTS